MSSTIEPSENLRPNVFDFPSAPEFLRALYQHYKKTGPFSLRQRTMRVNSISQGMVSQILNGRRNLNRDNLPAVAAIFKLKKFEQDYLDQRLLNSLTSPSDNDAPLLRPAPRSPKNHILSDWINPYVKDLVNLKGFSSDPMHLHRMLAGIATPQRITKATEFLVREGFWRREIDGKLVPEEATVTTTKDIPNVNIRVFHQKALELAKRGLTTLPVEKRKASTVLLSVNEDQVEELKDMIDSFYNQLMDYIDKNPRGTDKLVQVAIHLTPVGGINE